MSKTIAALALALSFAGTPATAARTEHVPVGSISGTVTDAEGQPIPGVRITVVEARRSTSSDDLGEYRLGSLPDGNYVVVFRAVGYRPETRRVAVEGDVTLNVTMTGVRVELTPLQVTATADASGADQSPQPTTVLHDATLRTAQAPTLGAVLDAVPGVRNLSTGQGVGKPFIRGLGGNRVLVLEDGHRLENAQWGDEHGPQVETHDADRVEVIRGPASVLYGSDALGGVVNVVQRELPDAIGGRPFARARASGGYASGSRAGDGGLLVEGASGGLGVRGSVVGRKAGDIRTPAGALSNSGLDALNLSGAAGLRGSWGHAALDLIHRTERLEVHEDPADDPNATPFQRVRDDRVRADLGLPLGQHRLEMRGGFQRNHRREFEEEAATDVALELTTTTATSDAHLHHAPFRGWNGILGISLLRSSTAIGGSETLVPASRYLDLAVLAFEQREFGALRLSAGLRFDTRTLDVDANTGLGVAEQTRRYQALSGSLGALLPLSHRVTLVSNLGRAWRAPNPLELFANGVHEGAVRFEVGDATLGVESSLNLDVALRWQSAIARGEVGGYVNRIDDFIFVQPTGATDPGSGFPIFEHRQGDALLAGIEGSGELHPANWLGLMGQFDFTRGRNRSTDEPLPLMPPVRASGTVRVEQERLAGLRNAFVSTTISVTSAVRGGRLAANEPETDGYTLLHLGFGAQLLAGTRLLTLDLGVRNVLDRNYRDFLSRYREYASEMGRSLVVRLSTDF